MLRHTHVGSCNVNTLSRSPPSQLPPSPSVSSTLSPLLCPLLHTYTWLPVFLYILFVCMRYIWTHTHTPVLCLIIIRSIRAKHDCVEKDRHCVVEIRLPCNGAVPWHAVCCQNFHEAFHAAQTGVYTFAQTRMGSAPLSCACYPHVYELQRSCAGQTAINDELFNTTLWRLVEWDCNVFYNCVYCMCHWAGVGGLEGSGLVSMTPIGAGKNRGEREGSC